MKLAKFLFAFSMSSVQRSQKPLTAGSPNENEEEAEDGAGETGAMPSDTAMGVDDEYDDLGETESMPVETAKRSIDDVDTGEAATFEKGEIVHYRHANGNFEDVEVVDASYDDELVPYYTIRRLKDGREKSTEASRLRKIRKKYTVKKGTQREMPVGSTAMGADGSIDMGTSEAKEETRAAAATHTLLTHTLGMAGSADGSGDERLPEGWEAVPSRSRPGQVTYFHRATNTRRKRPPYTDRRTSAMGSARAAPLDMHTGSKRNAASPSARGANSANSYHRERGARGFNATSSSSRAAASANNYHRRSGQSSTARSSASSSTRATATVNNYNRESGPRGFISIRNVPNRRRRRVYLRKKMGMHTSIEPDRGNKSSGPARITHSSKPFVSQCSWQTMPPQRPRPEPPRESYLTRPSTEGLTGLQKQRHQMWSRVRNPGSSHEPLGDMASIFKAALAIQEADDVDESEFEF